ncbi:MAG TPA: ribonuclease HII [Usitatibacter sp.]|nr:ribonuclease HII [Usitatibacter sp.]
MPPARTARRRKTIFPFPATSTRLCGVDEAGRGPLAGAVFAAAVVLDPDRPIEGLADSKALAVGAREELALSIRQRALAWAVAHASSGEIDALNILRASLLAMWRAIEALPLVPGEVQVDGLHTPRVACAYRAIVKGDATVPAISAASILAKTARDADRLAQEALYPGYGFAIHTGYPTPEHLAALRTLGPCEIHRRSFQPVIAALQREIAFE